MAGSPARPGKADVTELEFRRATGARDGAIFSPCRTWRYLIWRQTRVAAHPLDDFGTLLVFGVNPSDADEARSDHTLRKVVGFAEYLRYGRVVIANPYAYVSKDMGALWRVAADQIVGPDNDSIIKLAIEWSTAVVVAWGANADVRDRGKTILRWIARGARIPYAFRLNADGSPTHPARIAYGPLVAFQ